MSDERDPRADRNLERDALVMDAVYGGRRQDDLTETERAEVLALGSMREVFAQLGSAEPPARISAQLLAAAAAEVAGSKAPEGSTPRSWFARLTGWMAMQPALAAAASLALIAGVAGVLFVRGDARVAEPTLGTAPAEDKAAAAPTVQQEVVPEGAAGADPSELALDEEKASEPAPEPEADSANAPSSSSAIRRERSEPAPAKPSSKQAKKDSFSADLGDDGAYGVIGGSATGGRGQAAGSAGPQAETEAREQTPNPSSPPPPQDSPTDTAAATKVRSLHKSALLAAQEGACDKARQLARSIANLDPDYYEREIADDKRITACAAPNAAPAEPIKTRKK